MKRLLISTLEKPGYPVRLQGSIADDEAYPETFITYFILDSEDRSHYDNDTDSWGWYIQVCVYSTNPLLVDSIPRELLKLMKAAGFIPQGRGHDMLSDEPPHTGWIQHYYFIEKGEIEHA